mmetsp:Transcript_35638/g.42562  ORF Transcript_35638/g.42562 Transcript_35638/m.42562 type:complete len:125 (+) Transcript_35638:56-430(+)|eukprot:CAMPEP_0198257078 /NCGR_PEP_ID=MMETSP1447-20131203/6838_1 /TAXON_ID=420782 /ORGANISM="Chaetoceros dichaeta, Strain CCMP1751" /LENGTH=124 /DNA_ID=CAMNT_0043943883 /DNA_START=57 /DNA_END=431 /DNA_ORIENTATION=+
MRVAVILSLVVGTSAFGVSRTNHVRPSTSINGLPENMAEFKVKSDRWREIKGLSDEEAEKQLSGDELEIFKTYHVDFKEDLEKTKQVVNMLMKDLDPVKVQPKGKNQRKRDKFAREQAYSERDY